MAQKSTSDILIGAALAVILAVGIFLFMKRKNAPVIVKPGKIESTQPHLKSSEAPESGSGLGSSSAPSTSKSLQERTSPTSGNQIGQKDAATDKIPVAETVTRTLGPQDFYDPKNDDLEVIMKTTDGKVESVITMKSKKAAREQLDYKDKENVDTEFNGLSHADFSRPYTFGGYFKEFRTGFRLELSYIGTTYELAYSSCAIIPENKPSLFTNGELQLRDDRAGYSVLMIGKFWYLRMIQTFGGIVGKLYKKMAGQWAFVRNIEAHSHNVEGNNFPQNCNF